jgi:hypothetical protein
MPPEYFQFPLLSALCERRSRRFSLGMTMPDGPLKYQSRFQPVPLTEDEEAMLVFAASGVTGHALADLCFAHDGGGGIMAGLAARTVASGDGLQTVALFVTNDDATHLIRRPREMPDAAINDLGDAARAGKFLDLYRNSRVKIKNGRAAPPVEPLFNINANRWSAHAPGTTYFLPVNDLTFMYVNGLLEILNEHTGVFIVDDRNHFRPAGVGQFARSRGGHLEDDPRKGRMATIRQVEQFVTEFVTIEQGMMLQNLGLMAEAMGLGGFPNFANHEFGWFQALGFRMGEMPASRYLGAGLLPSIAMKSLNRDIPVPYPLGLEINGETLLKPFCPPYFKSMTDAVNAVVESKFGPQGVLRTNVAGAWQNPGIVTAQIPRVSDATVAAASAYCEYVWKRYGRFPATMAPYRTTLGFQAGHLDAEFYDKFYRPEALSDRHRRDFRQAAHDMANATSGSSSVKTAINVQPSTE